MKLIIRLYVFAVCTGSGFKGLLMLKLNCFILNFIVICHGFNPLFFQQILNSGECNRLNPSEQKRVDDEVGQVLRWLCHGDCQFQEFYLMNYIDLRCSHVA